MANEEILGLIGSCRFLGISLIDPEKIQDYSPYQRGDIVLYAGDQEFIFDGERFESLACVRDDQPKEDIPEHTNCVNCGATLSGKHRCRYCGTYNR